MKIAGIYIAITLLLASAAAFSQAVKKPLKADKSTVTISQKTNPALDTLPVKKNKQSITKSATSSVNSGTPKTKSTGGSGAVRPKENSNGSTATRPKETSNGSTATRPEETSNGSGATRPKETSSGSGATRPDYKPTKVASLTYFHFEDDGLLKTLVQNAQVNLQHCVEGYDKSVMLKDDFNPIGNNATKLLKPNKEVFLSQLKELVADGFAVDIYIFAHGSETSIAMANGKSLTVDELKSELSKEKTGFAQLPIRMVYQMNCYGSTLNQTWIGLGAKVACGAKYVNFYPNQFNSFAGDWEKGNIGFSSAVNLSNTASSRTVMQSLIEVDAAARLFPTQWDKCPKGATVLGSDPCSKSYFHGIWGFTTEWQNGKSGKDNMNNSSTMQFAGSTNLTQKGLSSLTWFK